MNFIFFNGFIFIEGKKKLIRQRQSGIFLFGIGIRFFFYGQIFLLA